LGREGITTLAPMRVLDVGCGGGSWLSGLTRFGADPDNLIGVDLRQEALRSSPVVRRAVSAADQLPFESYSFDMVCQVTMVSSILDGVMRTRIAAEMQRVLRPAGILLWYDFTVNPLNRDVKGVPLSELRALFPGASIRAQRVTLAPPLTRLLARRAWPVCEALELVPWLRTHLLAIVRNRGA
jgi:ubiquinone/menaquinone biosynthesis C-methylase UbiE